VIEQDAVVVSSTGKLAEVETQRRSACGSCAAKTGCGSALLAGFFGRRASRFRVLNPIQAQPGERVVIGMHEGLFLRAVFTLYSVPLLSMLGGALAADWLAERTAGSTPEVGSLVGGVLGLVVGLAWVRRFAGKMAGDGAYRAVILRRGAPTSLYVPLP
jgi:sigma-E factor negative regulatory protein RseC